VVLLHIAARPTLSGETIPPVPRDHFNDYANVVSDSVERALNDRLAAFERDTSNQVVVAVFPRMDSSAPVRDYTLRVAQAWGVGREDRDNGVVLFAFMQERQLYLQVGIGLEQRIPDSRAQRIIEQDIVPRFRARDIDGGLRSGVDAILSAIRAERTATALPAPPQPAAQQTPVEAAHPPPAPANRAPFGSPAPFVPTAPLGGVSVGGGGGPPAFIPAFFAFIVIGLIISVVRAIAGGGGLDYDSSQPRRPDPFGHGPLGHRPGGSSLPRIGGSGSFGGRSSSSGSFSRGGGGFRGGGAGGGW
jgi:uncharacterized protein